MPVPITQVTELSLNGVMGRLHAFVAKGAAGVASLNLRLKIGTTVLLASGPATVASGASDVPWKLDGFFVVRAIGSSGTAMVNGSYHNGQNSGLLANASLGGVSIDTTTEKDLQVSAEWGTADASNSITLQNLVIEKAG